MVTLNGRCKIPNHLTVQIARQMNCRLLPSANSALGRAMVDVALISYLLSSVASTAKIIEFAISLKGASATRKELDEVAKKSEAKIQLQSPSPELVAMANTVSGSIQEAITKKFHEIRERVIQIASDTTLDPVQRRTMLKNDQRAFCEELHLLKQWNGGKLPPDLQREWDMANCSQYTYY